MNAQAGEGLGEAGFEGVELVVVLVDSLGHGVDVGSLCAKDWDENTQQDQQYWFPTHATKASHGRGTRHLRCDQLRLAALRVRGLPSLRGETGETRVLRRTAED